MPAATQVSFSRHCAEVLTSVQEFYREKGGNEERQKGGCKEEKGETTQKYDKWRTNAGCVSTAL